MEIIIKGRHELLQSRRVFGICCKSRLAGSSVPTDFIVCVEKSFCTN